MKTNPENPSNEIEANIQTGITRRSFIKRTSATAIVTVLALRAFRNEAHATKSISYESLWGVVKSTHNYFANFVCYDRAEAEEISDAFIRNGGNVTSEWAIHAPGTTPHATRNPDPFNALRYYTDNNDGTCTVTIFGSVEITYAWY